MSEIHRLRITLRDVEPPVWRRLEVPGTISLQRLHAIIQTAMGWEDRHLYEFRAGGHAYGVPDTEAPDLRDARRAKLKDVAKEGARLEYTYDFGDDWHHDIVVERVIGEADPATHYPICVGGERACPPDDCGGPFGYLELLDALADRKHQRHDEMREWVGGFFDPEGFDANAVNRRLWGDR